MSPPQTVAGRYRIERRLGAGGMSTVFMATDSVLERPVAVKLLAEHLAEDEAFVARFRHEALSAARRRGIAREDEAVLLLEQDRLFQGGERADRGCEAFS